MTSRMAKDDIEALKEEGIDLTVEEIIRLNAFGLKVEKNVESSELYVLPRVAILGDLSFREPTIGSDIWLNRVSSILNLDDSETFIQVRAFSLSMEQSQLPDPTNLELVKSGISNLVEKLKGITMNQLTNMLEYVVEGNNPIDGERKAKVEKKEKKDEEEIVDENECFEIGVLNDGILLKLGTPSELKTMTLSRLLALVQYKRIMKYGFQNKEGEARKLGEYYAVLEEIKEAHKNRGN